MYVEVMCSTVPVCSLSVVPAGLSSHSQDASLRGTEHSQTEKVQYSVVSAHLELHSWVIWSVRITVGSVSVGSVGSVKARLRTAVSTQKTFTKVGFDWAWPGLARPGYC